MQDEEAIKKSEINKFLGTFKNYVVQRGILLIPREKNLNTLAEMGLTLLDVQNEILKLDYRDYITGPKEDLDYPGEIWEFGKTIEHDQIYIKLKLGEGNRPLCLSFHFPEKEIDYFFKQVKRRYFK